MWVNKHNNRILHKIARLNWGITLSVLVMVIVIIISP